jgi:holo-[acyl-carrier protein] synthase
LLIGIGIDIADQNRFKEGLDKYGDGFLRQILTEQEIKACARYRFPIEHYAGKFAVKEAFMKAAGTGLRELNFQDIEVLNRESGAPYILTSGKAETIIIERGITQVHVSLSHDGNMAVAVVVLEKN